MDRGKPFGSSRFGEATVIMVIVAIWLAFRLVTVLLALVQSPDDSDCDSDEHAGPSWAQSPQDEPNRPQDATMTVPRRAMHRGTRVLEKVEADGPPASTGDPRRDVLVAFRMMVVETVPRPEAGPSYFGGRDDVLYLRGWDDAVDWIGKGQDAKAPRWSDVAYMTGWNDAGRAVARMRRCA